MEEKLEAWQEAWVEQLVSIMETGFAGMPGIPNVPGAREFVRTQMVKWVKERTVEDARETAAVMMATAKRLLETLPESTVSYPSLPGSNHGLSE